MAVLEFEVALPVHGRPSPEIFVMLKMNDHWDHSEPWTGLTRAPGSHPTDTAKGHVKGKGSCVDRGLQGEWAGLALPCCRPEYLPWLPYSWLPWLLVCKESACNAGGLALIPGLGRSPGEGNGNSL